MTRHPLYVPILKGKEGEFAALEVLTDDVRSVIAPFIEVPPIPYDYAQERPARTLDEHVAGVADRLKRCWKSDTALYLDLPWFGENEHLIDGSVALGAVLGNCSELPFDVIPVVSRSSSGDYLIAARNHARTCHTGVCIRLVLQDFGEDADPIEELDRIRSAIGNVPYDQLDLVLDLKDLGPDTARGALVARSVLSMIPRESWRRVVLAAASFPEDLSDVDAATISTLPRTEWEIWTSLGRRPNLLPPFHLVFGDYGIAHPTPKELDPRTMRMSASIRYTTENSWLVAKGRNVRQYGFDQYYSLAKALTSRKEFKGPDFSWADSFIARCAMEEGGPGNATTWRKVGTNHHLTLVGRQLSDQRGT